MIRFIATPGRPRAQSLHRPNADAGRIAAAGVAKARRDQSCGSSLTIEAPWLLPVQNVTGLVVLSTNTRRMLVSLGSMYSTVVLVLGSRRTTRSVVIPPVQISPLRSTM